MRYCCLTLLLALLAGCSSEPAWNTKDISGLMPELAFTLTDENDRQVTAADYGGRVKLLFFGYTSCPDICPTTLGRLQAAFGRLSKAERQQVRVLFVSVDPERDGPAELRDYTRWFGPAFIGLTGTETQLRELSRRYRTTFSYGKPDAHGEYEVSHSSAVFVFDAQGRAQLLLRGSDAPRAVAADLKRLLSASS